MACHNKGIYKGDALCLLLYFMKMSAAAAVMFCLILKWKLSHYSVERVLTTYCQAVNHLLETYVTDDAIAGTESETSGKEKPWTTLLLELAKYLGLKTVSVHML